MTDSYILAKSEEPQGQDLLTPFESRDWSWVNDINAGVYANNGSSNSLIQYDLSTLYNSGASFIDVESMFLVFPVTLSWACTTAAGVTIAPTNAAIENLRVGLKGGYANLINQIEVQVNGRTLSQVQNYANVLSLFQMQAMMSKDDISTLGPSLGLGTSVDSALTLTYSAAASALGNGVCNSTGLGSLTAPAGYTGTTQFSGFVNAAFQSRLEQPINTTNGPTGIATICTLAGIKQEFRPYFAFNATTNISTLYDFAIIRLKDVLDCFSSLPLMQRFDGFLRVYTNPSQGYVLANQGTGLFTHATTSSQNTNPILINTAIALPATCTQICYYLGIGGVPQVTALGAGSNVNLSTGVASHPLTNTRLYFAKVALKPSIASRYISENRAKRIRFSNFYFSQFQNIASQASFSQLVLSGVSKPVALLCVPYVAQSVNGFSQLVSEFDSAPVTNAPISLINFQVALGGKNVLENPIQYGFSEFMEQLASYQAINYSDFGLTNGLISKMEFDYGKRFYLIDLARSNHTTATTPRNVVLSFTNNSGVAIDIMVFTIYSFEADVDVSSGMISPVFSSLT